jgi:hypothetical protein
METLNYYKNHLIIEYDQASNSLPIKYIYTIKKISTSNEILSVKSDIMPLDESLFVYNDIIVSPKNIGAHDVFNLSMKHGGKKKLNVPYENEISNLHKSSSVIGLELNSPQAIQSWSEHITDQKMIEYAKTFEIGISIHTIPVSFKPYPSLNKVPDTKLMPHWLNQPHKAQSMKISSLRVDAKITIHGEEVKNKYIKTYLLQRDLDDLDKKIDAIPVIIGDSLYSKILVTFAISDGINNYDMYPEFKIFKSISSEGEISIGENISSEMKKSYAFFHGLSDTKSTYIPPSSSANNQKFSLSAEAEQSSTYLIKLPVCLGENDKKPVFHVPALLFNMNSNSFTPLVNEDIVLIKFYNQESAYIS